jgi:hypothetical protein
MGLATMLINEQYNRGNDKNNNDHINELAKKLRFEILLREGCSPDTDCHSHQIGEFEETVERIKPTEMISIRELAAIDGALTIHCPICNSTWNINIYEGNYVFTDECKCRRCMKNSGIRKIDDFPLMPIVVEVDFNGKQTSKKDMFRVIDGDG